MYIVCILYFLQSVHGCFVAMKICIVQQSLLYSISNYVQVTVNFMFLLFLNKL